MVSRRKRVIWEQHRQHAIYTLSKKRLQLRFGFSRALHFSADWLNNWREKRTARLSWDTCPPSLCSSFNRRYANDQQQRCRNFDSLYSHLGWHSSSICTHFFFNLLRKNKRCKSGSPYHCLGLDTRLHPCACYLGSLVFDGIPSWDISFQHFQTHFCNLFHQLVLTTHLLDCTPFQNDHFVPKDGHSHWSSNASQKEKWMKLDKLQVMVITDAVPFNSYTQTQLIYECI